MSKLQQLLEQFRNDENWNSPNKDGSHRFDEKIAWIEEIVNHYAEHLNMSTDEVVDRMEEKRTYSWPNYYQPSNFPYLHDSNLIGIFKSFDEFNNHSATHWQGFKCPKCGTISSHPQYCIHRLKMDGQCDWCSFGLFKSSTAVIVLENGVDAIPIFEPVQKEDVKNE